MRDSPLATHRYWSALHCTVELHFSGSQREMHQNPSGGVLQFLATPAAAIGRVMSAETDTHAKAKSMEDTMVTFGGYK